MNRLLKSRVLALSVCAVVQAPVLAKGSPEPMTPSASGTAYMTRTVTTWMLVYETSSSAKPDFGHVDDIASEIASLAACEAAWSDVKEVLTLSVLNVDASRVGTPHKCIRVEKRAR